MTSLIVDPLATEQKESDQPENSDLADLPEKYKGKSVLDIVAMHQNAESELGRARNEVGTLRRLSDEFLGIRREELSRTKVANQPERTPITTDTLLERPDEVILSTIHEEVDRRNAERDARTARLEMELAETRFQRQFPGAEKTLNDPAFQEWVRSSPYRQKMAMQASQGDFGAAGDLFGLYDSVSQTQKPASSGTDAARKAALAKPGGSSTQGVVPSADGKKVYKRDELVTLRMRDPEAFERLWTSEDLETAYREKRVR